MLLNSGTVHDATLPSLLSVMYCSSVLSLWRTLCSYFLSQSLAGTLKAAKKRKVVSYQSELLLQGMSDKEVITLPKAS